MSFYLQHYFDPDFSHEKLTPRSLGDGDVCLYYLGYVQNVVTGQVLAELIDLDEHPDLSAYDPRFIYPERVFPCGPNCAPHPTNPSRIIATANGYCFYNDNLITVKKMLNVRRDVDFHTGNIMFVGDMVMHKSVRTGFTVLGRNLLVKGTVEGSRVIADGDLVCERGVKGVGQGFLQSHGNMKLPFCENMVLQCGGNLEVDGSCMHSDVSADGSIMVKGRLQGGKVYANNVIYVKDQIGGGQNTLTQVSLGYTPSNLKLLEKVEEEIKILHSRITHYEKVLARKPELLNVVDLDIRLLKVKHQIMLDKRQQLMSGFHADKARARQSKLICPGKVKPGLEVSIAEAFLKVDDFYENVEFVLQDNEIIINPLD